MEKFNNIGLARELTSCYDFQGFTNQEVWSRIAQKINIIIEHFNYLDKKIENEKDNNKAKFDYLLGQGLTEKVAKAILEKINDGTLGGLINDTLLKGINDKVDTFQETFTEQLDNIVLGEYIIDSTTDNEMTLNAILNTDYLRYRNNFLYADFFKKLRSGEYVKITCLGDSITYGYDITSNDRRPADTNPCDDGTYHHFERASKTYPEALSEFLNGVYNNKVTVINKGFAGDNTEMCYNRWNKNSKSDLTLINLGINDAIGDWNTWHNDLNKYILWYEKLICREIARGSAVVILIPHKLQLSNDISIDVFRKALIQLANKYNCPILDLNKAFANYSYDNYSDTTHLNGKGYTILAALTMPVFIGNGLLNIDKVVNNTVMLSRPSIENITSFGTTLFTSQNGGYTAWEYANNQSILTGFETGGGVVYSFETLEDNMFVIPNVWTNGSYKIELDFNVEQPYLSLYNLTDTTQSKIPSSKSYDKSTNGINIDDGLRIARKGKHTLKITSLSGNNSLNGIVFKSYPSENEKKKVLIKNTHNEWSTSPTQVNSIAFSINEIETCLGITIPNEEGWKCPTLKITVTNIDGDILTYALFIGRKNGDNYLKLSNVLDTFNLSVSNKTRTITSVSLDVTQQIITLNFGGALDSLGNVRIDLF